MEDEKKSTDYPAVQADTETFSCGICTAEFRESHILMEHMRGHADGELYKSAYENADISHVRFVERPDSIDSHVSPAEHSKATEQADRSSISGENGVDSAGQEFTGFSCVHCNRVFTRWQYLNDHMKVHEKRGENSPDVGRSTILNPGIIDSHPINMALSADRTSVQEQNLHPSPMVSTVQNISSMDVVNNVSKTVDDTYSEISRNDLDNSNSVSFVKSETGMDGLSHIRPNVSSVETHTIVDVKPDVGELLLDVKPDAVELPQNGYLYANTMASSDEKGSVGIVAYHDNIGMIGASVLPGVQTLTTGIPIIGGMSLYHVVPDSGQNNIHMTSGILPNKEEEDQIIPLFSDSKLDSRISIKQEEMAVDSDSRSNSTVINSPPYEETPHKFEDTDEHQSFDIRYRCCICQSVYLYKDGFDNHIKNHVPNSSSNMYECLAPLCEKVFGEIKKFLKHMKDRHGPDSLYRIILPKIFKCTTCDIGYTQKKYLDHHKMMKCQTDEQWRKCLLCDKELCNKIAFEAHINMHKLRQEKFKVGKGIILAVDDSSSTEDSFSSVDIPASAKPKRSHSDMKLPLSVGQSVKSEYFNHLSTSPVSGDVQLTVQVKEEEPDSPQYENSAVPADTGSQTPASSHKRSSLQRADCKTVNSKYMTGLISSSSETERSEKKIKTEQPDWTNSNEESLPDEPDRYKCPFCEKMFLQIQQFNKHVMSHAKDLLVQNMKIEKEEEDQNLVVAEKEVREKTEDSNYSNQREYNQNHGIKTEPVEPMETETAYHDTGYSDIQSEKTKVKYSYDTDITIPMENGQPKCLVCSKTFSNKRNYTFHMRVHTGERPYQCTDCGKSFTQNRYLTDHRRLHNGDRPYHCNVCNKKFKYRHNLQDHLKVHTGDCPYQCDTCPKSFMSSTQLILHQRTHSKVKPYECGECGQRFALSSTLRYHQGTHLKQQDKPFKCAECGMTFIQSYHLKNHMRTHSGEKPYLCDECQKTFSTASNLRRHKKIHLRERQAVE